MVVQLLIDSLSRCFGAPAASACSPLGGQPLGASKDMGERSARDKQRYDPTSATEASQNTDGARRRNAGSKIGAFGLELNGKEWDALFDNDNNCNGSCRSPQKQSDGAPSAQSADKATHVNSALPATDLEHAEVLAKARCAAQFGKKRPPSLAQSSSSSTNRASSLAKARSRANKRKADIFRSRNFERADVVKAFAQKASKSTPSFASRFLGNEGGFNAVLCFANPIRDDEEERHVTRLRRMNSAALNPNDQEDSETITSTLYFDAKYDHVVESRPPMPLYMQFSVEVSAEKDNELWGIITSESHKSINLITCCTPSPERQGSELREDVTAPSSRTLTSRDQIVTSMADLSSYESDSSAFVADAQNHFHRKNDPADSRRVPSPDSQQTAIPINSPKNNQKEPENQAGPEPATSVSSSIASPPTAPKQRLEVISDYIFSNNHESLPAPHLKLLSKSSLSTAATALTPSSSIRSMRSISPMQNAELTGSRKTNFTLHTVRPIFL